MKRHANYIVKTLFVGCFVISLGMNHFYAAKYQIDLTIKNQNSYHISSDLQKQLTFGYERMLSVLYWFDIISDFGGKKTLSNTSSNYTTLATRLDSITTLNPYAESAYLMAAVILPWQLQNTKLSRPLLKKAMRAMPNKWIWPYYYGFNAYWFDHDMDHAAQYMTHAASLPNAPITVMHIASKMSAKANNLDAAISFLQQLLNNKQQDESIKKILRQRIATIKTEKILRRIEDDLMAVPGWKGDASRLHALQIHIPFQLPDGGIVMFDKQHRPISSKQSHRFKVFVPPHLKKELEKHE